MHEAAANHPLVQHNQLLYKGERYDRHRSEFPHSHRQSAHDLSSRGVAVRVQYAGLAVRSFAPKRHGPANAVKSRAPMNQPLNLRRSFLGKTSDGFFVAKPRTCGKRIRNVQRRGVGIPHGGSDAALSIA